MSGVSGLEESEMEDLLGSSAGSEAAHQPLGALLGVKKRAASPVNVEFEFDELFAG